MKKIIFFLLFIFILPQQLWALPRLPRWFGAMGVDSEITLEQNTLKFGTTKTTTFLLNRRSNLLHQGTIWHPNFLLYDFTLTQRNSSRKQNLEQEERENGYGGWDFNLSSELLRLVAPLYLYGRRNTTTTDDEGYGLEPSSSYGSVNTAYGFDWSLPFARVPKFRRWPNVRLSLDKYSIVHDDLERADENEWSTLFDLELDKDFQRPHGPAHLEGGYSYESTTKEADLNSISSHDFFLEGDTPLTEKMHLSGDVRYLLGDPYQWKSLGLNLSYSPQPKLWSNAYYRYNSSSDEIARELRFREAESQNHQMGFNLGYQPNSKVFSTMGYGYTRDTDDSQLSTSHSLWAGLGLSPWERLSAFFSYDFRQSFFEQSQSGQHRLGGVLNGRITERLMGSLHASYTLRSTSWEEAEETTQSMSLGGGVNYYRPLPKSFWLTAGYNLNKTLTGRDRQGKGRGIIDEADTTAQRLALGFGGSPWRLFSFSSDFAHTNTTDQSGETDERRGNELGLSLSSGYFWNTSLSGSIKYLQFEDLETENIVGEEYVQWREDNQSLMWDVSLSHFLLNRVSLSFSTGFMNEIREDPFDPHREDTVRYSSGRLAWRPMARAFLDLTVSQVTLLSDSAVDRDLEDTDAFRVDSSLIYLLGKTSFGLEYKLSSREQEFSLPRDESRIIFKYRRRL